MILMCPPLRLGKTPEERAEFLRRAGTMEVKTFSTATPADWSDQEVEEARVFLDAHGLRVGEFSGFHGGFGSANREDGQAALQHYRRQLRHARILNAHCVGFSIVCDRCTPQMWSEETWRRCVAAVKELTEEAERVGVDVAAHPHIMSPLCSVERHQSLIEAVASLRLKILMDPVNLTWPHLFYRTTELVNQIFDELGHAIVAFHAKDVTMSAVKRNGGAHLSVVHLDEAVPGAGALDYATILRRLNALGHDVTLQVEHFSPEETVVGQQHIRQVAREAGVHLH
ncbi:MAG: sugar phosphate isomerase/epimerase [Candidatus Latescibacteria bacterium]|nr:sugar phosphate isomerase/epimerase [Candidatus Latescibacterota bacterium]